VRSSEFEEIRLLRVVGDQCNPSHTRSVHPAENKRSLAEAFDFGSELLDVGPNVELERPRRPILRHEVPVGVGDGVRIEVFVLVAVGL